MICLLHGYLLDGSGSNLWTRSVVRALVREGTTVHLVCQEPHPEKYDFISEAIEYHPHGRVQTVLDRRTDYAGRCIMHQPMLGDTLPVYVWDAYVLEEKSLGFTALHLYFSIAFLLEFRMEVRRRERALYAKSAHNREGRPLTHPKWHCAPDGGPNLVARP